MSLDQPTIEKFKSEKVLNAISAIDSFITGNKHDDELKKFEHE